MLLPSSRPKRYLMVPSWAETCLRRISGRVSRQVSFSEGADALLEPAKDLFCPVGRLAQLLHQVCQLLRQQGFDADLIFHLSFRFLDVFGSWP